MLLLIFLVKTECLSGQTEDIVDSLILALLRNGCMRRWRRRRRKQKVDLLSVYMCRVLPKLMPDWVAPLLEPYCREMTFWPARSCSSLKLRTFLSASLGPIDGLLKFEAYSRKSDTWHYLRGSL